MKSQDDPGEDDSSEDNSDQEPECAAPTPSTPNDAAEGDQDDGSLDQALEMNDLDTAHSQYLNVDGKKVSPLKVTLRNPTTFLSH